MIRFAPVLLLGLVGCATGSLDCADLRQGACKVSFQRFLTDTSATFTGPEGLGFTYSSNPNAAATQEAFAAINRLAGLVGTVAAGRLPVPGSPVPLVPSQPVQPIQPTPPGHANDDDDDAAFRHGPVARMPMPIVDSTRSDGSIAAQPRPPMLGGVAHALEL
jgi:hypothetical protein